MIWLDAVSKRYPNGQLAISELSLEIAEGELCVLVGPSGCGKTTTMRMINRLVDPTSGRVLVDGRDVAAEDPVALRRRIGYVIQQIGLFPHQTVAANIATVPRLLGWDRSRIEARVEELLGMVDLDPAVFRDRYPDQLSGGQQQRVGVARALAADPPILLMDEPFGALDPQTRQNLQLEFRDLQRRLGKTVVFVTHDLDEAVRVGDRVAVLRVGGVLDQVGTPAAVLGAPATPFVAEFVGADRGVKRLAVVPLEAHHLNGGAGGWQPVVEDGRLAGWRSPGGVTVPGSTPVTLGMALSDVLARLLTTPADGPPLGAVGGDGSFAGVVSADALLAAARTEASPPSSPRSE
jgi:osmoprotectant transport system ATP-binding protein